MSIDSQHHFPHHNMSFEGHNVTGSPVVLDVTTGITDKFRVKTDNSVETKIERILNEVLAQSTTRFAQTLQDVTTRLSTNSLDTVSQPEVTIRRPDVPLDQETFGTAEKVVVGAAVIVVCLAIIAILLRLLAPYFRNKKEERENEKDKFFKSTSDLASSKLSFTNLGCESVSQSTESGNCCSQDCSQSSGSTPATDWSELSKVSSETQSSASTNSDENMFGKNSSKGFKIKELHEKNSTTSLPAYINDDRFSSKGSSKGSPSLHRRQGDEQVSVISTQSLEPLRLEQNYRNRWDDQFDPCGSLPRGNLSHLSHPSESRLTESRLTDSRLSIPSIVSAAHTSDAPQFPIPSRDYVRQIHLDKERRYPSNTSNAKKEKHVRMSAPNR